MVKSNEDVGGIEARCIFLEPANLLKIEEQLATRTVLKYKEKFAVALKCIIHLHDERMFNTFKYSSFCHCMLDLIAPDKFSLLQDFKGIELSSVLLLDKYNLAKGAFTNDGYHLKVFLGNMTARALLLILHAFLILSLDCFFLLSHLLWT